MSQDPTPRGVVYLNNKSYEYQVFPEEYFSGQDVALYFGDTWVDDIMGIEFKLFEAVTPVFGYASRIWDFVNRSRRYVQGTFRIAFKEAGYLETILDHLAQIGDKARPALAYHMAGQAVPQFVGQCNDRIEDILARYHYGVDPRTAVLRTGFFGTNISIQSVDRPPTTLQMGDIGEWIGRLQQALKNRFGQYCLGVMSTAGWPTLSYNPNTYSEHVKALQQRLTAYGINAGLIDGYFGQKTRDAVGAFQFRAAITRDGIVGPETKSILGRAFTIDSNFGNVTRLVVCQVQKLSNLEVNGTVGPWTAAIIWPDPAPSPQTPVPGPGIPSPAAPAPTPPLNNVGNITLSTESRMAQYEQNVWGRSFDEGATERARLNTYFYNGPNTKKLYQKGFDIYFIYGPLNQHTEIEGRLGETAPFNTTVRAIRNIQFTSLGQIIDNQGLPIEEVIQFIGQDLD